MNQIKLMICCFLLGFLWSDGAREYSCGLGGSEPILD